MSVSGMQVSNELAFKKNIHRQVVELMLFDVLPDLPCRDTGGELKSGVLA